MDSLRSQTGRIRHLDAEQAGRLVSLFARPIVAADPSLGYDHADPVAGSSCGWLTLHQTGPADAHGRGLGHYATHLYLHELLRLPLSVARQLARHRGHLYLDKLVRITDAVAAILATHRGGGLSLGGIERLSEAVAGQLVHHPLLELNGVQSVTDRVAAILATHEGGVLSLRGLKSASSSGLELLRDNPDVILPPRLARPGSPAAGRARATPRHPSPAELERIIAAIAAAGEARLAE